MSIKKIKIVLWVFWLSIAGPSQGADITGSIGIVGGLNLIGSTGSITGIHPYIGVTASGISAIKNGMVFWDTTPPGTGDYASVPFGVFMNPPTVTFGTIPLNSSVSLPNDPLLWSFNYDGRTYSLDLTTVSVQYPSQGQVDLSGQGLLEITGSATFEPTPATWTLAAIPTDNGGTAFSSSATANPISAPEIDASSGTSAIALLIGTLLVLSERSRRSYRATR